MSEKNQDVIRALASFGSEPMVYHSFGPFVVRPRVTYVSPESIGSSGERLASPALPNPETRYYDDPLDEPAMAPLPKPVPLQTAAFPPVVAPSPGFNPPAPRQQPPAFAEPPRAAAPPPMSAPEPVPLLVPQAPLYPLLAAALPEASEPVGAPLAQPPMPIQAYAANPSTVGAWQGVRQPDLTQRPMSSAMPQGFSAPQPGNHERLPVRPLGTSVPAAAPYQPTPRPMHGPGGSELPADRRSLTDMFRVLSGRPEQPEPPPAAEPPPIQDAQALFRRI